MEDKMADKNGKPVPKPIGPYSVAAVFEKLIYTSGQLGIDPDTGEMPDGVEAQTALALENLKAVLELKGGGMDCVLKTTVFLDSMDDFAVMNGVYQDFFTADYPARSAVEVARLPKGALVEIEAVGYKAG